MPEVPDLAVERNVDSAKWNVLKRVLYLTLKYVSTVLNGQMKAQRERDDERRNG